MLRNLKDTDTCLPNEIGNLINLGETETISGYIKSQHKFHLSGSLTADKGSI